MNYPKLKLADIEKILEERFAQEGFLSLRDLPRPSTLKDMEKATSRIARAVRNGEKIVLIGDYDVDGVVSTTLMTLFFDAIGVQLKTIIPNRFHHGYGLSPKLIDEIRGYNLAITVDNGISATEAAKMCREEGIELIITDHHLPPPELPHAHAIVNQKQKECTFPYEEICGAQIAWYLIASLRSELGCDIDIKGYLDLVSLAVIADMMPLKHINRAMVIAGLAQLSRSSRPAFKAFREHISKEIVSADDVAFFLAPMLNSAGRLEDASYALKFLLSPNIYEARANLGKLLELNDERKHIEQTITAEALGRVEESERLILVHGEEWHEGVLGIVAARVSQQYNKPVIVLTRSEEGLYKGSGRSFGACDLFDVTSDARELLTKFGGHKAAIGLSIYEENLPAFRTMLQSSYDSRGYEERYFDADILGEMEFADISFELTSLLQRYEPYGQENQRPKFISRSVRIIQVDTMGKNGEHLRYIFEQEGTRFVGVQFKAAALYGSGDEVDIVYRVNENSFRGEVTLQLFIENINIFD